ncbi:MAG: hypothetical protein CVU39_19160 [Chloroflexi bacterium HGW-Chloroflexi-10]|nr:MAG: hypothetical protein CVU39_19160 [Chloroflexi bacterium HGW-Chloroflexi-10]
MPGFSPDPLTIEVISQGPNQPCRIRLLLPDGSGDSGALNPAAFFHTLSSEQNPGDSNPPITYGEILYQALFPGNLSNQFSAALKASNERGIRLTLQIDSALPALHRVNWERMFYPQGSQWLPMATSPYVVFSRHLQSGKPWGLPITTGRLKILIVISSPFAPGTNLYVDVAAEQQSMLDIFSQFPMEAEVEVLAGVVSAQQIADRLIQGSGFDILHYIGHGEWREAEQTGFLILSKQYEDGSIGPDGVPAAQFTQLLGAGARLPQLIFLGACESGQQSSLDAFTGVGPQLVQAGCPAVVCMQEKVENAVARQFSQSFYAHLLESGCVDQAVNRARTGLLQHNYLQWATPVLYMHLADGIIFNPQTRFKPAIRQPYKFLAPYQKEDNDLFKGRQEKINEVVQSIRDSTVTVVYGEAGIGVTSLLQAGVRPLLESAGSLVLRIADYSDLAGEVRKELNVDGHPLVLRIRGDAPLVDVLRAVSSARFENLVLVLDQFEQVLSTPEAEQLKILDTLVASLRGNDSRLKLVLLLHKDALGGLAHFQPLFTNRAHPWIEVFPLKMEEAVAAIVDPLDILGWPVTLNPIMVRNQIVPDLGELYPYTEDIPENICIDPGQLQITCTWLYQKARDRRPPLIDEVLYLKEAGGADGILVRYMEEELKTRFAGQSELARHVLVALAAPELEHWVLPEQLTLPQEFSGAETAAVIPALLDRLVKAELLIRRLKNGQYVYAFANQMIAAEAVRLGGEQIEKVYNAADEVERIWRLWLAAQAKVPPGTPTDQVLATPAQLHLLTEHGRHLDPKAVKLLLLLRSAVLRNTSTLPWLERLGEKEKESGLIHALEGLPLENKKTSSGGSSEELAGRILGLRSPAMPPRSIPNRKYGDVSWSAVRNADALDRQSAALALTVLDTQAESGSAYHRLEEALKDMEFRLQRFFRRAELFGILEDAGQSNPQPQDTLQRMGIYLWRTRKRALTNRHTLIWASLGGALGAGLGLGLERLLIGMLAQSHTGVIFFALFSYWGFLLGGLTALGTAFSGVLLLEDSQANQPHPRRAFLQILLGAAGFGLANLLVAFLNGISLARAPLVIPLGFVAGIGISAMYAAAHQKLSKWLIPAAIAGLLFILVQFVFLMFPNLGSGLAIALSSAYFQVEFEYFSSTAWQKWITSFVDWTSVLSLIESGFAGLALIFGGRLGLRLAGIWYERWRHFVERSDG